MVVRKNYSIKLSLTFQKRKKKTQYIIYSANIWKSALVIVLFKGLEYILFHSWTIWLMIMIMDEKELRDKISTFMNCNRRKSHIFHINTHKACSDHRSDMATTILQLKRINNSPLWKCVRTGSLVYDLCAINLHFQYSPSILFNKIQIDVKIKWMNENENEEEKSLCTFQCHSMIQYTWIHMDKCC